MRYVFIFGFILTFFASCEEDDICIEQTTPHLVVRFNQTNPSNLMDSVVVYKEESLGKFNLIYKGIYQDSVKIALPVTNQNQVKFLIGTRTYDSKKQDLLVLDYQYQLKYFSKACGFGVQYLDTKYSLTQHFFNSTEILQHEITSETAAHIQLNY